MPLLLSKLEEGADVVSVVLRSSARQWECTGEKFARHSAKYSENRVPVITNSARCCGRKCDGLRNESVPALRGPGVKVGASECPQFAPALEKRIREALATPGRPGVRVKRFGVRCRRATDVWPVIPTEVGSKRPVSRWPGSRAAQSSRAFVARLPRQSRLRGDDLR
jgi:hypothetical protein